MLPQKRRTGRRFPAEVLTQDEVERLMAACPRYDVGVRNRAMIALLYRTGLRLSEALMLHPKDVDLEAGTIRVLFGKRGYARTVGIDASATLYIARWIEVRTRWGPLVGAPLLCSRTGGVVTTAYVRRLMPVLGRKAKIAKRVHAHGLRHTHASELRSEGVDIGIISKQLGHKCITTTARYLDHIAPTAVIEVIRKRTWAR